MSDIAEVFDAIKRLQKSGVVHLRELLEDEYSTEWSNTNVKKRSVERKIKNKLATLVELGLVNEEKVYGKNIYSIKHYYPVKSKASDMMKQLIDIIREDEALYIKAQKPMVELLNEIKSPYYIHQDVEDISSKEHIVSALETAINDCNYITIRYEDYDYKIRPLKIAEFEGIWYLLLYYDKRNQFRKYPLKNIMKVQILKEKYEMTNRLEMEIDKWHNVWHQPMEEPTKVTVWISNNISKYLYQKNIFNIKEFPHRVVPCDDGIEYEIHVTHRFELLPQLMYWQPNIVILKQEGKLDVIGEYHKILRKVNSRNHIN